MKIRTLLLGCLATVSWAGVASAEPKVSSLECAALDPLAPAPAPRELLDPRLRGLALSDLPTLDLTTFPGTEALAGDAAMVDALVRQPEIAAMNEILSTSIVSQQPDHWVVDVLGRAPRFVDHDTKKSKAGRVGLVRVRVPVSHHEAMSAPGQPELVYEMSFSELALRVQVSLADWVAIIEDTSTGFKRLMPLAGGGIDRGVRVRHVTTAMTPTTEDGLLDKRYAYRELSNPWYFKKKPYLPIAEAYTTTRPDGTVRKTYRESNIAFHIWQGKGFERGFFSRGCMRMRTEDLAELAAFVFSAEQPIPIVMRMPPRPDVHHPFPMAETYYEMVNVGTADRPRHVLEWGQLYKITPGKTPLPAPEELIPLDFRDRVVKPKSADANSAMQ